MLRLLLRLLRQGGATAAAASYHRAPQVEGDEGSVNTPLSAPPVLASAVFPKSAAVFLQVCQLATLPPCQPLASAVCHRVLCLWASMLL